MKVWHVLLAMTIIVVILLFAINADPASAHGRGRHHWGWSGSPAWRGPPPNYYWPGYWTPYYSYPLYPCYQQRIRIPGYWEWRRTPLGWKRIWIRGYWEYR